MSRVLVAQISSQLNFQIAMSTPKYTALIKELCQLAKISDAQAHAPTADFVVDDIGFTVIEAGHNGEDAVMLFCDFGSPPSVNREQVLAQLLHLNLAMQGINTPAFAMNPDSGHVLLTRRVVIDALSANDVLQVMAEHSVHAREWQQHQYLRLPSTPSPSMPRKNHAMRNSK